MLFVYGIHKKIKSKNSLQVQSICFLQRPPHKERASLSVSQGSMTVEAAMVMPIFVLVICGIMRLFVLMNFQNLLQIDLDNTARELSCMEYVAEETEGISIAYAAGKVLMGKSGKYAEAVGITGGRLGISFLNSEFSEEEEIHTLEADYKWGLHMGKNQRPLVFQISQCSSYIPWIGESLVWKEEEEKEEEMVYITPNGTVYHTSKECTYLTRMVRLVSFGQINQFRNLSGGKYKECEKCGGKDTSTVYITAYGDRFHTDKNCSTLIRFIKEIKRSEVKGRRLCTKCGQKKEK